ncbi:WD repeat-containing protein [Acrasis kona]|uniref:WD repeat-containing protein n=1 Tax=Acrasis kona TaxID=1008807 RepID=A0AAW2ZQA0_9EUKA
MVGDEKPKHIVLVAGSGGVVQHWHLTSGRMLNTITEKDNQVYAVDYRADSRYFATAGKDAFVRLYDETTKQVVHTMNGGNGIATAGHANRIFTLKFNPHDENIIMSGGWDNTVQIWDIRQEHAVRRIFGPHICGDSLDIDENYCVLAGSWRPDHQLQLFDFGTGRLIEDIKIVQESSASQPCNLYSCQFADSSGTLIGYGGSGNNQAKIISRSSGKIVGAVTGLEKAVYSVTFSSDQRTCAVGGGDGNIYLLQNNAK